MPRDLTAVPNEELLAIYRDTGTPPADRQAAHAEILHRDKQRRQGDAAAARAAANAPPARVAVVNFDMPFGDMVVLICKWALASLPAMLVLALLGTFVVVVLAGIGAALR